MSVHFWGEKTSANDSSVWKLLIGNSGDRPATLKSWRLTFFGTKEDPQPDVPIIPEVLPQVIVDQPQEKSGELEVVEEEVDTIKPTVNDETVDEKLVDEKAVVDKKVEEKPVIEKADVDKKVDEKVVDIKVEEKPVDEKVIEDETTIGSEKEVEDGNEETVNEEEEAQESQTVAR